MIETYDTRSYALGDGVITQIDFDFLITKKADILFTIVETGETPITFDGNDTTYLSSLTFDAVGGGGTATLLVALASGKTLYLDLNVAEPVQSNLFRDRGGYSLRTFETALDYVVTAIQTIFRNVERSVKFKRHVDISTFDTSLPDSMVGNAGYLYNTGSGFTNVVGVTSENPNISGVVANVVTPIDIVSTVGIPFSGTFWKNEIFVKGTGGVIVSANPRIAAGTTVSQTLEIVGTSDADFVQLADGNGISTGGQTLQLGLNSVAKFKWIGSTWLLTSTNGIMP